MVIRIYFSIDKLMFYHLNPTAVESTAIVVNTIALLELLVTKHFANLF